MFLKDLSLVNFKNYEQAGVSFSPGINCIVGLNGSGKTNILDAIHYLCLCKSYFNPVDSQNIRHMDDCMIVQGNFERNGENEQIYCGVKRNKKKSFKRNKKEYSRLSDHIGLLSLVMISPLDSGLILDGSEERRKFMNSVISQSDHAYLEEAIRYNHFLAQRNKLLKQQDKGGIDQSTLDVYNEQLVASGNIIYEKRRAFTEEFIPIFQHFYDHISSGQEKVKLIYQSQLHNQDFASLLAGADRKDRILQYSTVGVHKDDLELRLRDYNIKKTGSQGQQKTYLVALKLAKYEFLRKINGFTPLLLLDDIFDKFDRQRVGQIISLVSGENFGQVFITHTDLKRMQQVISDQQINYKLFEVELGTIQPI